MIFATVGTQLPFDRLIESLDEWSGLHSDTEVFAQIGRGTYIPKYIRWVRDIDPQLFRKRIAECDTVVAHAGMGTIISAVEMGKRVIIMPRLASLSEHRNDHQLATASRMEHLDGLEVVHDAGSLASALENNWCLNGNISCSQPHPQLVNAIRRFAGLQSA